MLEWVQIALYIAVLLAVSRPLGVYIAKVMDERISFLRPVEGFVYRLSGVNPAAAQGWKGYSLSVILFGVVGFLVLYALQRLQGFLPINPTKVEAVSPGLAFNTASSFVTNTDWQSYAGESTMSRLTQMLGLVVQNFVSAAVGVAVAVAFIRGLRAKEAHSIGNFWVDLTRTTLYILLPLATLFSLILVGQGVVQTFGPDHKARLAQPVSVDGKSVTEQTVMLGPVASQVAIKQLGTNGGGYFNVNSAHPFENPTPLTNFLSTIAILLIPAALCWTFGEMIGDRRQGIAVLAAMTILLIAFTIPCVAAERSGNPMFHRQGLAATANWEGKETRVGIAGSALWATATTAASNGSVNSMHDSYTPMGGMMPMVLMQLGEVVFGGVGSGLYGMLIFALIAVFVAGLMVGRTPEYLGKKIEPFEMKMASLVILIPCVLVLVATAVSLIAGPGADSMGSPGPHGFSRLLYNYSSMANNNGSAFAGFNADVPFHNVLGGVVMWISRYWVIVPVLAVAGSLAGKKVVPVGPGTLPTHTPLFVGLLVGTVLIVGLLTFIPSLALGPVVEHLVMQGGVR